MGKVKKSHGNMYDWVTHMWTPGTGCPHQCSYCYVTKNKKLPEKLELEKPFPDLGKNRIIFVGFECDLFAKSVPDSVILEVIEHCNKYRENRYVFQSKDPERMYNFIHLILDDSLFGTTIESNSNDLLSFISKAPSSDERFKWIKKIKETGFHTFITVEPIMKLGPKVFAKSIVDANPDFVNIGADSKGHGLLEPTKEDILEMVDIIRAGNIEIRHKENLSRILG